MQRRFSAEITSWKDLFWDLILVLSVAQVSCLLNSLMSGFHLKKMKKKGTQMERTFQADLEGLPWNLYG